MEKRRVVILPVIGLLILMAVISVSLTGCMSGFLDLDFTNDDRVVVIYLYGTIEESNSSLFESAVSPAYVRSQLASAAADDAIKGVILRINSPGGSVAASQEIASLVREFNKPVVVSMADMAASGGYYIAAPADGIVAQPGTMTGSIGVITQIMIMDGLYELIGIEVETIKSGDHKDMYGRALTDEEREMLQQMLDEAYEQFITAVAEGRGLSTQKVRELATGQLYLGSQAFELGLVDRLGGIDEALAYVAEIAGLEKPVLYYFPEPSLYEIIFSSGYSITGLFDQNKLSPEMILLDKIRQGFPPELRYQVK